MSIGLGVKDRALLAEVIDTIVLSAREFVVITDADTESSKGPTIEFVNDAAERVIGVPKTELIGQPLGTIVLPENLPHVLAQIRGVYETGEALVTELKARNVTGREYWIELSVTPVFGPDRTIRHFVRIGRDITVRKQAMQQRDVTQRLLASVFSTIDNPLLVTNAAGEIMMMNSAVTRQLGWSVFDSIGKPVSTLISPDDRSKVAALISANDAVEPSLYSNVRLVGRNGAPIVGKVQVTSVKHSDSQMYKVIKLQPDLDGSAGVVSASAGETAFERAIRRAGERDQPGTTLVAGKLQLVGLDTVREKLGDRWPDLAERTFALAERVIKKYLLPGDIYRRSTDDGFLVFFGNLSEAEAQFKAAAIGAEIRERLMGEIPEAVDAQVVAFAASVDVHPAEATDEVAIIDLLGKRLEEERRLRESAAQEAARAALRTAKVIFQNALTDRQQPAPIVLARPPRALRQSVDTLRSLGKTPFSLETEVFLLAGTGQRLLEGLAKQPSDLILTPVRVLTLSQPRDLEAWLKVARTLGDIGRRQVVAEVTEVPPDIAQIRLRDIAMRLSTLFRSIAFELPVAESAFAAILPDSTRLATISVRHLTDAGGVVGTSAARLVKSLALRNCRLIVKDATPPQASALAKLEVPFVVPAQDD